MKILITGGAGFIGLHLAKFLADQDHDLTLVDNLFRGKYDEDLRRVLSLSNVRFIEADLTKTEEFEKLGSGYSHIYHLAAVNGTKYFYEIPAEVLRINILTTVNVLEWMRASNPKGKLLFTSSNEAYAGLLDLGKLPLPTPETVPLVISDVFNSRWSYAATKLIGEVLVANYAKQYGLEFVVVRPHNFYGSRAGFEHVIPQFLRRLHHRENPFKIFGAEETRSFCYIEDAIRAMTALMETPGAANQIVHIGTREEMRIRDLADIMFKMFNFYPEIEVGSAPEGSVKRRLPDIAKLEKLTSWKPQVSLEDGVRRTYEWYINRF